MIAAWLVEPFRAWGALQLLQSGPRKNIKIRYPIAIESDADVPAFAVMASEICGCFPACDTIDEAICRRAQGDRVAP